MENKKELTKNEVRLQALENGFFAGLDTIFELMNEVVITAKKFHSKEALLNHLSSLSKSEALQIVKRIESAGFNSNKSATTMFHIIEIMKHYCFIELPEIPEEKPEELPEEKPEENMEDASNE